MPSLRQSIQVPKLALISKPDERSLALFKSLKGLKGADLRYAIGYNMSTLRAFGVPISSRLISLPYDVSQAINTFNRGKKFMQGGGFKQIRQRGTVLALARRGIPQLRGALIPRTSSKIFNRYANIYGGRIIQQQIISRAAGGQNRKQILEAIFRPEVIEREAKKEFTSNKSDNFLFKWQQAAYMRAVSGAPDPIRNNAFVQAKAFNRKQGLKGKTFDSRYGIVDDRGEHLAMSDKAFSEIMSLVDQSSLAQAEETVRGVVNDIMSDHMAEVMESSNNLATRHYRKENISASKDRKRAMLRHYYNLSGSIDAFEGGTDGLSPEMINPYTEFEKVGVTVVGTPKGSNNSYNMTVDGFTSPFLQGAQNSSMEALNTAIESDVQLLKAKLGDQLGAAIEAGGTEIAMLANNLGLPTPDFVGAEAFGITNKAFGQSVANALFRVGTHQSSAVANDTLVQKADLLAQNDLLAILNFIDQMADRGFNSLARTVLKILSPKIGGRDAKTKYLTEQMRRVLVPKEESNLNNAKVNSQFNMLNVPEQQLRDLNHIYGGWFTEGIGAYRQDVHYGVGQAAASGAAVVIGETPTSKPRFNVGLGLDEVYIDPAMVDYYDHVNKEARQNTRSANYGSRIYRNLKAQHRADRRASRTLTRREMEDKLTGPGGLYYDNEDDVLKELKAYEIEVYTDATRTLGKKGLFAIPYGKLLHPLHSHIESKIRKQMGSTGPLSDKKALDLKKLLAGFKGKKAGTWSSVRLNVNNATRIPSDQPTPFLAGQMAFVQEGERAERQIVDITTNSTRYHNRKKEQAYRGVGPKDHNYVPNKIDIAESIHILPIHQKGKAFITAELIAGTSKARIGPADKVRDIEAIEYGGPATDANNNFTKRTDGMIYLPSLFFTRACEEAAAYLGFTDAGRVLGFDKTLQRKVGVKFRLGKGQYTSAARAFKTKTERMEREVHQSGLQAIRRYRRNLRTTIRKRNYSLGNDAIRKQGQRIMTAFNNESVSFMGEGGNDRFIDAASIVRTSKDNVTSSIPGMSHAFKMDAFGKYSVTGKFTTGILNEGFLSSLVNEPYYDKFITNDSFAVDILTYMDGEGMLQQELGRIPYQKLLDPAFVKKMRQMGAGVEANNLMRKIRQLATGVKEGGFKGLQVQNTSDFEFAAKYFGANSELAKLIGVTSMDTRAHIFQALGLGKLSKVQDPTTGASQAFFKWNDTTDITDLNNLISTGRSSKNSKLYHLMDNIAGPGAKGRLTAHYLNVIRTVLNGVPGVNKNTNTEFRNSIESQAAYIARKTVTGLQTVLSQVTTGQSFDDMNALMLTLEKVTAILTLSASAVVDNAIMMANIVKAEGDFDKLVGEALRGNTTVGEMLFNIPHGADLNNIANMDDIVIGFDENGNIAAYDSDSIVNEAAVDLIHFDEQEGGAMGEIRSVGGKTVSRGGSMQEALKAIRHLIHQEIDAEGTRGSGSIESNMADSLIQFNQAQWKFKLPKGNFDSGFEAALNAMRASVPVYSGENKFLPDGIEVVDTKFGGFHHDRSSIPFQTASASVQKTLRYFEKLRNTTKADPKTGSASQWAATPRTAGEQFIKGRAFKALAVSDLTHSPLTIEIGNILSGRNNNDTTLSNFEQNVVLSEGGGRNYLSQVEMDMMIGNVAKQYGEHGFGEWLNGLIQGLSYEVNHALKMTQDPPFGQKRADDIGFDTLHMISVVEWILGRTPGSSRKMESLGQYEAAGKFELKPLHQGEIRSLYNYFEQKAQNHRRGNNQIFPKPKFIKRQGPTRYGGAGYY